jgi:hypothetical protein
LEIRRRKMSSGIASSRVIAALLVAITIVLASNANPHSPDAAAILSALKTILD